MFPRIREIVDERGHRLRVSVDVRDDGAVTLIELPARGARPRVELGGYATELLAGFIMSARLAVHDELPDEFVALGEITHFRLARQPAAIVVTQDGDSRSVEIPFAFWDKLYAELCLVVAHVRQFGRYPSLRLH